MRDSFAMDHTRQEKKAFLKLSLCGFLLFLAIFLCSLIAVALLVYNFAVCPEGDSHASESHFPVYGVSIKPTLPVETSAQTSENTEFKLVKDLRLPRSVKPIMYDITLLPFLTGENFTFNGDVAIKIQVDQACSNITLHAYMLKINWNFSHVQKLVEDDQPAENISISSQYFVDDKQFLVIETAKTLEANHVYIVRLQFTGSIKDNLQGFYKSSYNVGSETRWIASTQFQATDARRYEEIFHFLLS